MKLQVFQRHCIQGNICPILFSLFSVYLVYVNSFSPKMCISISKLNNCAYQVPSYLWKSSMQWIWLVASTVNGIPSKLFPHTTQVKQAGWYGFPVALRSYNNKPNTWTPIEKISNQWLMGPVHKITFALWFHVIYLRYSMICCFGWLKRKLRFWKTEHKMDRIAK